MTDHAPDEKATTTDDAAAEDAVVEHAGPEDAPTEAEAAPPAKEPAAKPAVEDDDIERERSDTSGRRGLASPAGSTVTTVVATVAVIAVVAAIGIVGYLFLDTRNELSSVTNAQADRSQAEKVAGEYAAGAAAMDFRDLGPWRASLVKGVSPELKAKMDAAGGAMTQLLVPLQWASTATVSDTVVTSQSGPIYKVNAYVKTDVSNIQHPDGGYVSLNLWTVTLDKDKGWQVTDSGGDSALLNASRAAEAPAPPAQGRPAPPADGAPSPGN